MATNLELKLKVNNFEAIIQIILKQNGKFEKVLKQKDTYFKYDKGLLKLREQNGDFELVKYNRNEKAGERWSDYNLLFIKGENIEKYLSDLFKIEAIVKKTRNLYLYKNTRIHLDEVKKLGNFLELETVVKNISREEAIKEFNEIVNFLNLDLKNEIRKSYRDLIIL
ncbi:MAG: class IV adenylate cyclase [Ignavibacteriales bacterium]|nr:class IV adenylate cyclase [Ignavibacteriales bacterium]